MENTKPRLFCFGDSFVNWPEPLGKHWTNLLNEHFSVFNFGYSGSSNEEILFQFNNLPEYIAGDRIITVFTEPSRLPKWYWSDYYDILLKKQSGELVDEHSYVDSLIELREYKNSLLEKSTYGAFTNNSSPSPYNFFLFLKVFKQILTPWKPVFVTWSHSTVYTSVPFIKYISREEYTTLFEELKGDYDDQHPGEDGNKKWAKILLTLLNED